MEHTLQECELQIDKFNSISLNEEDFHQLITNDINSLEESIGYIEKIIKIKELSINKDVAINIINKLSVLIERLNVAAKNFNHSSSSLQITEIIGSINDVISHFTILSPAKALSNMIKWIIVIFIIICVLVLIAIYLISPCICLIICFLIVILFLGCIFIKNNPTP